MYLRIQSMLILHSMVDLERFYNSKILPHILTACYNLKALSKTLSHFTIEESI